MRSRSTGHRDVWAVLSVWTVWGVPAGADAAGGVARKHVMAPTLPTVTWPPRMTASVADAPDDADPGRASAAREASTNAE